MMGPMAQTDGQRERRSEIRIFPEATDLRLKMIELPFV